MLKTRKLSLIFMCVAAFSAQSQNIDAIKLTGGVYVATNNESKNSLIGYRQHSDGTLSQIGEFKTGGKGTGLVELFGLLRDDTGHTFTRAAPKFTRMD